MFKKLVVAITLLMSIVACGQQEQASLGALSPNAPEAVREPAPTPVPATPDRSLESPEQVAQWQNDTNAQLAAYTQTVQQGAELLEDLGKLSFTGGPESFLSPWALNPNHNQDWEPEPIPLPTLEDARNMEANDQEWQAGKAYFSIGRKADTQRCAKELEQEFEWEAAAQLHCLVNDLRGVKRCFTHLQEADQISRAESLIEFAIMHDRRSIADALFSETGWEAHTFLPAATIKVMGGNHLRRLVEHQLQLWDDHSSEANGQQSNHLCMDGRDELADIHSNILAVGDLALARQFLSRKSANVAFFTWSGEGEGYVRFPQLIEFYEFIAKDRELEQLFRERVLAAAMNMQNLAEEGSSILGIESFNGITSFDDSYFGLMHSFKDHPRLRKIWSAHLDALTTFDPAEVAWARYFLTGTPPDPALAEDLNTRIRYSFIKGRRLTDIISVDEYLEAGGYYGDDIHLPGGEYPKQVAMHLWEKFELPTLEPAMIYQDPKQALLVLESLNDQEARMPIIIDLARSGHCDAIPGSKHDNPKIAYLCREQRPAMVSQVLLSEINERTNTLRKRFNEQRKAMRLLLSKPINVSVYNTQRGFEVGPSEAEAIEMIAPFLQSIETDVSEASYTYFLPEPMFKPEIRRLTAERRLDMVEKILEKTKG